MQNLHNYNQALLDSLVNGEFSFVVAASFGLMDGSVVGVLGFIGNFLWIFGVSPSDLSCLRMAAMEAGFRRLSSTRVVMLVFSA